MIVYEKEELTLLGNQGHCNKNYLLKKGKLRYLIREFQLADRDRKLEFKIQKRASLVGIAPKPLFLYKDRMVTQFVAGMHQENLSQSKLLSLAKTLRILHQLPRYNKPVRLPLHMRIKSPSFKSELVLSHGDLSVGNILFSNSIYLIDWEYSGVQDRYFDLASICEGFKLTKCQERKFLRLYSRKRLNPKKLHAYKLLFRRVSKEWFKKLQKGQLPFV
jgi:thiamine kinase-like enzyme